ncbi:unnamed protein product [Ixodes persulcatus]
MNSEVMPKVAAKHQISEETRVLVGFSTLLDWRPLQFSRPLHSDIVCGLCGLVSMTPVDPGCGHFYCLRCYRRILSDESTRCPLDDSEVLRDRLPLSVPWAVLSVTQNRIRCPNASRGCQYVAEPPTDSGDVESALSHLEEHFAECQYHLVSCQCCGRLVLPDEILNHLELCWEILKV